MSAPEQIGTAGAAGDEGGGKMSAAKETTTDPVISKAEGLKRFEELDRLILAGFTHALISAKAMHEMDQGGYYTFGGFKTIAEYGLKIRKLAESTVHQYVNAGRVAKLIEHSTACRVKPVNEAQLRPLLSEKDDTKVIEIWSAAETLFGAGGLTEKAVAKAKRHVLKLKPSQAPSVTVEQIMEKVRKALRSCWDACPKDGRPNLLGEVFIFSKALSEDLDKDDISPALNEILAPIGVKPEEGESDKPVGGQNPTEAIRGRRLWDLFNWDLRNADLADIWRKKKQTVRQMRCRYNHVAAMKCSPKQYRQKLEIEKLKAKEFGQSVSTDGTPPS